MSTQLSADVVDPGSFPVREGEEAWTAEEVAELVEDLRADQARQRQLIAQHEVDLAGLRAGAEGAGRDAADVGFTNFTADQEISMAVAARDSMERGDLALRLIQTGGYGVCESCGEPIGKGRLQVFPRATMCVRCKQRTERR